MSKHNISIPLNKLDNLYKQTKVDKFYGPQLQFEDPAQPQDFSENHSIKYPSIDSPHQSLFSPIGDQQICFEDLQQQQQKQQKQQIEVEIQKQKQQQKKKQQKQKDKQKEKQKPQQINECILQYFKEISWFDQVSEKKQYFEYWELFQQILLGFLIFYIPLQISFDIFNLKLSIILLKFLKIIIRLFEKKQIFHLTKEFFYQYAKQDLIQDSIFTCFTIFLAIDVLSWFSFFIVLIDWYRQMKRLVLSTQIKFKLDCFADRYGVIRILFLVNLMVCLHADLLRPSFENTSLTTEYIDCLYQVLKIITFNWQLIPKTQLEQLYCILLMLLGLFTFLFVMRTTMNYKFDDSDQNLLDECKKYQLNRNMIQQVMLLKQSNNLTLLQILLQQYKNEQKQQKNIKLFMNYFKGYNQEKLKNILIEEEEYLPCQTIIKQDQLDDCSLYYIVNGLVKVSINDFHTLGYLSETQNFGDIAFFTGQRRNATVTSVESTKVLKISLNQFLKQLDSDDWQKYHSIRCQFINNQQYFNKCFCCQKTTHMCQQCPLLNYISNPKQFLFDYAQSLQVKQNRNRFDRELRKQQKYKSLKVLDRVRVCQVKFNFLNNEMNSNSLQTKKNLVKSQDFISNFEVSPIMQRQSLLQNVRVKDDQHSEQYLQQLMISQTGIQRISQTNIGIDSFYQTTNLQKRMNTQDKSCKSAIQCLDDPLSPIIESLRSLESDKEENSSESDGSDTPFKQSIDQLRDFNIYYPKYNHEIIVDQVNKIIEQQKK